MDFIVYLVSMVVFIYLMYKRIQGETQKGVQDPLKDFLDSLDQDELEIKKPPPPKKKKKPAPARLPMPAQTQTLEQRLDGQSIVSRHFQDLENATPIEVKEKPSLAHTLLAAPHSKKQMIIYAEILNGPKSFRSNVF